MKVFFLFPKKIRQNKKKGERGKKVKEKRKKREINDDSDTQQSKKERLEEALQRSFPCGITNLDDLLCYHYYNYYHVGGILLTPLPDCSSPYFFIFLKFPFFYGYYEFYGICGGERERGGVAIIIIVVVMRSDINPLLDTNTKYNFP